MILLTGCAGFIGFHVSLALLAQGYTVLGVDNLNAYYDESLKQARLSILQAKPGFTFLKADIAAPDFLDAIAPHRESASHIIHLAAQAGVRYSVSHPMTYAHSNVVGHLQMLELARSMPHLKHFLYASSSSVYGNRKGASLSITDDTDAPVSLYAATKKSGELMTHAYGHLYGVPATGLRFFTVYGPYGRPDMAYYGFSLAMKEGRPITVFANGELKRDFTYIDDIVNGIVALLDKPPETGVRVLNLGNHRPETVNTLIDCLERSLGYKAEIVYKPREPADVEETFADISETKALCDFTPAIRLEDGIARFADWFKTYHA